MTILLQKIDYNCVLNAAVFLKYQPEKDNWIFYDTDTGLPHFATGRELIAERKQMQYWIRSGHIKPRVTSITEINY